MCNFAEFICQHVARTHGQIFLHVALVSLLRVGAVINAKRVNLSLFLMFLIIILMKPKLPMKVITTLQLNISLKLSKKFDKESLIRLR